MKKSVPKLNAAWHQAHPMPKNATLEQRINWHLEHKKNCSCRDIPERLKITMQGRGIKF